MKSTCEYIQLVDRIRRLISYDKYRSEIYSICIESTTEEMFYLAWVGAEIMNDQVYPE